MYVHDSGKIVYIAHPKTASSSISHAMNESGEWEPLAGHHEVRTAPIKEGVRVISVIREPFDWYVSWYFHYKWKEPFPKFLKWFLKTGNQHTRQGDFFGLEYTTDLLFFERLHEGLDALFDDLGLDRLQLQHRNHQGREGRHWSEFFDQKSSTLLATERGELLKLYGDLRKQLGDEKWIKNNSTNGSLLDR